MSDTVIRVVDVSKQFNIHKDKSLKERLVNFRRSRAHAEEFWALRDIDIELQAGHTLGLIGHNGSGKSTLLKIIGGILTPNTGYVERRGRLAALLELGAGFHGDLTGRENVFLNASILGLTKAQTEHYFDEIVDFSGIEEFIDTQVKFYSSGMYVRLAFSVAVHVDPEILLVDEVLAVGDEPFQRKCMDRIKSFQRDGRSIVFVTHGFDSIRQLCDRVILLDHGRMVVDGSATEAIRRFHEMHADDDGLSAERPTDIAGDRVRIKGVAVTDGAGIAQDRFAPGDAFAIEIDCDAEASVADLVAGIALTDESDQVLYGTNTDLLGVDLGTVHGKRRLHFGFDHMPFPEGRYYVTVALHPKVGPEHHRIERVASFRVFSDRHVDGVVYLEPQVRGESL